MEVIALFQPIFFSMFLLTVFKKVTYRNFEISNLLSISFYQRLKFNVVAMLWENDKLPCNILEMGSHTAKQ